MFIRRLTTRFELSDFVVLAFHGGALAILAMFDDVPMWSAALVQSTGLVAVTLANAAWLDPIKRNAAHLVRVFVVIFSCIWGYERANALISVLHGSPSWERWFIEADELVFGGHASVWTEHIHHPILTEYLQFSYLTYFILPLIVALFLIGARKWNALVLLMFAVVLATHQNFVWYVLVPVRSPFLVVETAEATGTALRYSFELQGLWYTDSLRQGLLESTTMRYDCFPSGHTALTLVTLYFAWRLHRVAFWVILPTGSSIIFSTIYLRYHYLVDLVAGALLAGLTIWAAPRLVEWWRATRAAADVETIAVESERSLQP